ncbi:PepSY domain-containing protein [Sinomicrobium soli]|uniref:PepSY domain-containing protein n=1 Tax=Sinomicrobium sp. N-1-3-6 TaxID=2219864 RepID=UPI000DCB7C35|nr:PepSY domain-containing protein [Sinomicrobium sp. N-1-3-6]RAV30785.1 FAD-binding oxidoreductase [Sinomicrobium sp. N-1-3-6]
MTVSIWRYSHLALAVSSFVFIVLASVTGAILAFRPVSEQLQPYKVADPGKITLGQTIAAFKETYPEIMEIKVDANDFVIASVFTEEGEDLSGYFDPRTAAYLGEELKPSPFFQWVTSFHRSLFMKGTGRFFVGLCSFLLFLIAVTGSVLIIRRQRGIRRFFSGIVNENFNQYWHVVSGRLSLIPIVIITATGVYLSLEKFHLLPGPEITHRVNEEALSEIPRVAPPDFEVFKRTPLSEVTALEFPFSPDVGDYFILKKYGEELLINQYTGDVLSRVRVPGTAVLSTWSLNLHTGKGSIWWSVVLAVASVNILFFVYSGFAMTLRRRRARWKNSFGKGEAEIVVLAGSENGSTLTYAAAFCKQLTAGGHKAFIAEMNAVTTYPEAKHLVVITATYGQGDPPANAGQFLKKLEGITPNRDTRYSVVGFGSLAYPDYCRFAFDADRELGQRMTPVLPVFTINDKSVEDFGRWVKQWSGATGISVSVPEEELYAAPRRLRKFKVVGKTDTGGTTFLMTLKPRWHHRFTSGDLLAVYPGNDYRERLYSIGEINGNIRLSVKLYENGLGSGFLHTAGIGETIRARLVRNPAFHFPARASEVVLIANGTGVAPFLGMLYHNRTAQTHLYLGLRDAASYSLYRPDVERLLREKKLDWFSLALSREEDCCYVQDKLRSDAGLIAGVLDRNGVVMVCGSLGMYKNVLDVLETICPAHNGQPLSYYQERKQIRSDCY